MNKSTFIVSEDNIRNTNYIAKGLILMYHRVTRLESDPRSLAVAPENFTEQIRLIKRDFTPVKLTEMVEMNESENLSRPLIALTFDDGYRDNYLNACRILNEYQMPATFFLVSKYLGSKHGYWGDLLGELLLEPGKLPPFNKINIDLGIEEELWNSAGSLNDDDYYRNLDWVWQDSDPTPRHTLYRKLYAWMRMQPEKRRNKVMTVLCAAFGTPTVACEKNQFMSKEEAAAIASDPLFDIGTHTMTHQDLTTLSRNRQKREISNSKKSLELITGEPSTSFSYTYGRYMQQTINLVKKSGFMCACTVEEGVVHPDTDPFLLPRIHIKDWNGETFEKKISRFFEFRK